MFIYRPEKKTSIKERNVLIIFKFILKIYIEQQNNEKKSLINVRGAIDNIIFLDGINDTG